MTDRGGEFKLSGFGVVVRIRSNAVELLQAAKNDLTAAFGGTATFFDTGGPDHQHTYSVIRDKRGRLVLFLNGKRLTSDDALDRFLRFFNSLVRITVAEHAQSKVFVHAGVVGWGGKALLLPGRSFQGKSTLVNKLIRLGAEYFSDEYAVIDESGLVHPFPRPISLRLGTEKMVIRDVATSGSGISVAVQPAPVGYVLFTEFKETAVWKPEPLSLGSAMLEIIKHTIPFTREPGYSLKVLNTALNRAIIFRSPRGDADEFAGLILDFFDNCN